MAVATFMYHLGPVTQKWTAPPQIKSPCHFLDSEPLQFFSCFLFFLSLFILSLGLQFLKLFSSTSITSGFMLASRYPEISRGTTKPFKYDLDQVPHDYMVEVTNRFKGLDLIDRVPEELWTEVHKTVQEAVIKAIPPKKKWKWLSEEALQMKRREVKGKGEKERYTHLNAEFQRIARRDKKTFLSD